MKQAFRLSGASALSAAALTLLFILGALCAPSAHAQSPGPTPEPFVIQITSTTLPPFPTPTASPTPTPSATPSPTPTPVPLAAPSYAFGISGNGRFVVIESSGDIATLKPGETAETKSPNNRDGNREIFLFDYAQRRIYQITDTRSALKDAAASPLVINNIDVEVTNNRPVISYDGKWIVFTSNAYVSDTDDSRTPKNFNGNDFVTALKADANQEVFVYRIPDVPEVDLTSGVEQPEINLSSGAITRITRTPASFLPTPGVTVDNITTAPKVADDNRHPTANDDASVIAFVSSRNFASAPGGPNDDLNPEIFAARRLTSDGAGTYSVAQLTRTANTPPNSIIGLVYNANPSLSADGATFAFISTADDQLGASTAAESADDKGNPEVYIATLNTTSLAVSNVRHVTRTPDEGFGVSINVFSPGRRLSRNGNLLAFETRAELSATGATTGALQSFLGTYVFNAAEGSYRIVGPRADAGGDVLRFPTFTGDSSTVVFSSALNFRADGTAVTNNATEGLNPFASDAERRVQIFSAPAAAPTSFTRLTKVPAPLSFLSETQAFPAETVRRLAFSYARTEFGGGNADQLFEAFYQLLPPVATESSTTNPVSYFTGASDRAVVGATPAPTPPAVSGLAPGMLGIGRAATGVTLAPSTREVDPNSAQESERRPPLPVELNGVSVAINNAAAGLFFVAPGQINFVVPVGLAASTTAYPVVINQNGTVYRSTLLVNAAQPDLSSTTNGAGGRAIVFNVTNPLAPMPEPAEGFAVTTGGQPTRLSIMLTGVRNAQAAQVTVNIKSVAATGGKDVNITGANINFVGASRTSGFDQIIVTLPADLAGAGESTVIVSVIVGGQTFTSRPADTAPHIRIQ